MDVDTRVKYFIIALVCIAGTLIAVYNLSLISYIACICISFSLGLLIDLRVPQDLNKAYNITALKEGIDRLESGGKFETFMHQYFMAKGYKVMATAATGDFGADLVLTKFNKKIVVQCKLYSSPVGIKAVQEVVAAKNMYQANHAMVVTNSTYTKAAIETALAHRVELWDGDILTDKLYMVRSVRKVLNEEDVKSFRYCPLCQSRVVLKKVGCGTLAYCKAFPEKCDYVRIVV